MEGDRQEALQILIAGVLDLKGLCSSPWLQRMQTRYILVFLTSVPRFSSFLIMAGSAVALDV